jgi:hypothetical protein
MTLKYTLNIFACILMLLLHIAVRSQSQQGFSNGWDAGYQDGYSEYNLLHHTLKPVFLVPISPIAPVGYNTYEEGYKLGFNDGKTNFLNQCGNCYDDGWKAGYEEGYCEYNLIYSQIKPVFTIPLVPVNHIGYTSYKDGYKLGYTEGKFQFLKQCTTCFNDGWEIGYEDGYCNYNLLHHQIKPHFIVPTAPIATGYYSYEDGYKLGFTEGENKFIKECNTCSLSENHTPSTPVLPGALEKGTFRDGWKAGYENGYCEYSIQHHSIKPLFITPIAPIAPIGYDTYHDGYRMGIQKGKEDFKTK